MHKLYLRTYSKLDFPFFIFFLFKYDDIIIKIPSNCSFGKKVGEFLKNKNHCCLVPSRIWESVGRLGGLDNFEYGSQIHLKNKVIHNRKLKVKLTFLILLMLQNI